VEDGIIYDMSGSGERLTIPAGLGFKALASERDVPLIERTARDIVDQRILGHPIDVADRRERGSRAVDLLRSFGFRGAQSATQLIETVRNRNSTPIQRDLARRTLYATSEAVFGAMMVGPDDELRDRVGAGADRIREILPEPLKGIEREVASYLVSSQRIADRVSRVEVVRRRADVVGGAKGQQIFADEVDRAMDDLAQMTAVSREEDEEIEMAMAYLNIQAGVAAGVYSPGRSIDPAAARAVTPDPPSAADIAQAVKQGVMEAMGKDEGRHREQRKDFYQALLLHRNTVSVDPMGNYAPEWMAKEDKVLLQTLIALGNACYYKWRYGDANLDVMTDLRGEATFSAPNEMMQRMYEMPGVRESMEYVVQEFFDLVPDPMSDPKRPVMVLRLKAGDEYEERLKNIGAEQIRQMGRLVERGIVADEVEAFAAMSTAFNWLYVGHTFECADPDRRLLPSDVYVEQMRAFMYPLRKARAKQLKEQTRVGTEEGWGGQLGQWLTGTIERAHTKLRAGVTRDPDITFLRDYEAGRVHPFPERLFGGFLVMTQVDTERGRVNLATALHNGWRVNFTADGTGGNRWGEYSDVADSAGKLYKIVRGDERSSALPLGDDKARTKIIDWAGTMADARNKLKSNSLLKPYVNTAEFVQWAIAACTQGGLFPSAELVLMTPDVDGNQDLDFDLLFSSRALVSDAEAHDIKERFHAVGWQSKFDRGKIRGTSLLGRRKK
jgi:hypothetical protein